MNLACRSSSFLRALFLALAGIVLAFPQTSDPQILRGKPCINSTRIPVALVLGYLAAGRDAAAILREFPDLKAEDVSACLDYARDLAEFTAAAA